MTTTSYPAPYRAAPNPDTSGCLATERPENLERGDPPVGAHDSAARMGRRTAQPEVSNGGPEPRVAGHRAVEEELLEAELALEDVALGQAKAALDVERGEHLAVEDDVANVRGDLGDPVDDGVPKRLAIVVPRTETRVEVIWRVLDEAADHVLAGRRHRRINERRNDHVDVRP